jgi:hypothetical protein
MAWALSLAFLIVASTSSAQTADATKPVLAFGPWFNKKISPIETHTSLPIDSSKVAIYGPQATHLKELSTALPAATDSAWRVFLNTYQDLANAMKGDRSVEPYLITDDFLNELIMLASRARMPLVANAFIQESKRIHPTGTYRTNRNCKHE